MNFFEELKRRNVFKVGIAYLVGSWLLIQITDILLDNIGAPAWVLQTMFVALGVGFFITLFFAWAFEMTPEGVKREKDVDRSQSITPTTGKKLNSAILVLMAVVIGYLLFDKFSEDQVENLAGKMGSEPFSQETASQLSEDDSKKRALTPAGSTAAETAAVISRQSIAVLPFDNRSRVVEDEYFVEGIHDDLLTNLARISSLKVISRTSMTQYKDTQKTIPVIAKELGVANILEGAVQRSGNTVRINVQLIDAKTDEHLWAEIFDRELTAENLFAIQSEISEKIASALEATLSPAEESNINQFPTQSLEAYNAYLRGRQLLPQRNSADLGKALAYFEQAVEIDPEFALAWVGIAETANLLSQHGTLAPAQKNRKMKSAIARALDINPQLGEAYVSQGSYLHRLYQWKEAEIAYQRGIELSPNYATAYQWYSILVSNTHDRLQESLDLILKAAELDPLSPIIKQNIANIYGQMGRFTEQEATLQLLLAANPDFSSGMIAMGWNLYSENLGQIDDAIVMLQKSSSIDPGKIFSLLVEYFQWVSIDDDLKAQAVYQRMEDLDADNSWLPVASAIMNIKHGRLDAAKEQAIYLQQKFHTPESQWWAGLLLAWSGNYDQAREVLLRIDPRYLDRQQWFDILNGGATDVCMVGLILLRTGDESLGNDLLRYAANYWQEVLPRYVKHADRWDSFACYAFLGDVEKSLDALEVALDHKHALVDWTYIVASPEFRSIRETPRFQAMDQKARAELARQRENLARMEAEADT